MLRLLPLLFIVELMLGIFLSRTIGFMNTLMVYFVPTFLGLTFFSFQNQMIWFQFQKQMASGRTPDGELLHLVAKFAGAFLMIVPSIIARLAAVLLLLPLTRHMMVLVSRFFISKKIAQGSFKVFGDRQGFGAGNHNFRYYNFGHEFEGEAAAPTERDAKVINVEAIPAPDDRQATDV
jgi:UPF0716 family protein affecting phage T7 exclusion